MATIVLVPGAHLGAWCWHGVTPRLRALGHEVYPMTLTGLGERAHLSTPEVDVETHVTDVLNVLRYEDLHDVVLVGHSYAGLVVTAVADRAPERTAALVYVDTSPLPDGMSLMDVFSEQERTELRELVRTEGDGWLRPMMSVEDLELHGISHAGMTPDQITQMRSRATPQPFRTHTQPVRLDGRIPGSLPRTVILCTGNGRTVADVHATVSANPPLAALLGPAFDLVELPTGHFPMFSLPEQLTAVLHRAALTATGARPVTT